MHAENRRTGTMPLRRFAPHHHDKPFFSVRGSTLKTVGRAPCRCDASLRITMTSPFSACEEAH
ncbi:MAG: hypothetical protein MSA31_02335 [Bacteroidales bacterium]|nr:hypothetical protein [Bacteroidales bacterium]